ncbi:MAG: hypothetical protein JWN98_1350, partial [Abditibacteriota bacterium]|nr:hypothetical protein [Abditibacteriota bacterium]
MPSSPKKSATSLTRPPLLWLSLVAVPCAMIGAGISRSGAQPKLVPAQKPSAQTTYEKEIRPLISEFCGSCHGPQKPRGGIDLMKYESVLALQRDHGTWDDVVTQIHERNMPPEGKPQPTMEQRDRLTQWIKETLDSAEDTGPRDPGRILIHRLSRTEYNNTVRDLFGISSRPADQFPTDGSGGGGFDNNADTLFVPPILMEKYLDAATKVLEEAKPELIFFVKPRLTLPRPVAARKIVAHFATRAFRRPVEAAEVDRLMRIYQAATKRGSSYEDAVKLSLKAVLISPNFLFRVEKDQKSATPYAISDYELASRLSYFLWSSMPDDTLFKLAGRRQLRKPEVLEAQVRRMMLSPKFGAMANSFASQWLRVRDLYSSVAPDPRKYKEFTSTLRDAMYNETITFFQDILRKETSLLQLIDADYTYLNEELANHYGIEGVKGATMQRVALKEGRRGGLLTMGSVLTLTSFPQRTSPVLRGKWVLEEILGTPAPPPPPNAGGLSPNDAPADGLTFRQRLEKHREKPECASCHNRMDPIGFGLENFDGIGRWREEIGGTPVDSKGVLANGETFSGPIELKKHILTRKDDFIRNFSERMLSYALGRGLEAYDRPTVRAITAKLEKDNYRSSTLIM